MSLMFAASKMKDNANQVNVKNFYSYIKICIYFIPSIYFTRVYLFVWSFICEYFWRARQKREETELYCKRGGIPVLLIELSALRWSYRFSAVVEFISFPSFPEIKVEKYLVFIFMFRKPMLQTFLPAYVYVLYFFITL